MRSYIMFWSIILFILLVIGVGVCIFRDRILDTQCRATYSNVVVTAYNVSVKDPRYTACMDKPVPGRSCAISWSLVRKGWLGKKLYVEGHGIWVAQDIMNRRFKEDRVDLLLPPDKAKVFTPVPNILAVLIN